MSKIIRSSSIVEKNKVIKETSSKIEDALAEEARKKYEITIKKADIKAKKIIEDAKLKADNIVNAASKKAKDIQEEARNTGYDIGYKDGYDEGYKTSYDKGYSAGEEKANELIDEALNIKKNYINTKKNLYREVEEDVIKLILAIYKKIFYEKLEEDENTITSLVLKGLDSLDVTDCITIIVSKEDAGTIGNAKNKILSEASLIEDLEIKIDNKLSKGDCIIETSKGNVDVSLKEQIEEIEELLLDILNSE